MQARTLYHLNGVVKFEALIQDHKSREQTATYVLCIITEAAKEIKKPVQTGGLDL